MSETNKWRYDVKNVHYIPGIYLDTGSVDFTGSTWKPTRGVTSFEADPQGDRTTHRADGQNYIVTSENTGYSITMAQIMEDENFQIDCLGYVRDTTTGLLYEDANAEARPFALGGEFTGNHEGKRWIYYNCIASRTKESGENKDKQKDPDTSSWGITASPMPVMVNGHEVMLTKASIKPSDDATAYANFFNQVVIPGVAVVSGTEAPTDVVTGG